MTTTRAMRRLALPGLFVLLGAIAAPAQEPQKARLRLLLPAADVQLEIQGVALKKKLGADVRLFESPPLEPGKNYIYDIKATWTENGKQVVRERSVRVAAGKTTEVDLRVANQDSANATTPKQPAPEKKPMPDKPTPEKPKPEKPAPEKPMPEKPKPEKPMTEKPAEPKPPENYVATPPEVIDEMLQLAKVGEKDVVFVIGCSDGRIANTAAVKIHPRKVIGVDSNSDRLATAHKQADAGKVSDLVNFRLGDPTKTSEKDLAEATVVIVDNLVPKQLAELAPVLKKLKPGTRLVVHNFEVPGMKFTDKRELVVSDVQYTLYSYDLK